MYIFPYEEAQNGRPYRDGDPKRNALHSKIMLIQAPLGKSNEMKKLVVIGTHNFDMPSLKLNNELMLEIYDDKLFDAYEVSIQRLLNDFLSLPPEEQRP